MLLSLILFGSRARGDHRLSSDVDLLGVVDSGAISDEISTRGASCYKYPFHILMSKCQGGDLFALHLVAEGRVLHDTADIFERIRSEFRYKKSYNDEVTIASSLVWFFVDNQNLLQKRESKKRLVWALRTILIARSAEKKVPSFSSKSLAEFARQPQLKQIIDRRFVVSPSALCEAASSVALMFGKTRAALSWPGAIDEQYLYLNQLGGIAKSTVESERKRVSRRSVVRVEQTDAYL